MKTLSSSEFRRVYPSLDEPTEVTALGRLIGTWFPVGFTGRLTNVAGQPQGHGALVSGVVAKDSWRDDPIEERFNTQKFSGPIEKSRKKR